MNTQVSEICFVVNAYPTPIHPRLGIFIKKLVEQLVDTGVNVTVIHPQQVSIEPRLLRLPYVLYEPTPSGAAVTVYRPKTFGLGQQHRLGISPVRLTTWFLERSALRIIRRHRLRPDVIYGHFLAPSGVAAARIGRRLGVPSVCAFGESHPTIEQFGASRARAELTSLAGSIAVSSYVKDYLRNADVVPEEKITVIPNGFDERQFFPISKSEARAALDLDPDKFIVGYVGSFDARKGIDRLVAAVDKADDTYLIAAGTGPIQPTSDRLLFAGAVPHEQLNTFYNAMDVFVLPTRKEGCPNAVVEAVGSGIPIISSNRSFNDEILDDSFAIRVDPDDVDAIAAAIRFLRDHPQQRLGMSRAAQRFSPTLWLSTRTQRILDLINRAVPRS